MSGTAPVVVRTARSSDLEGAIALLEAAALPTTGVESRFMSAFAVAESNGRIVGVAGIERYGSLGLLRSAATAPEWRGQGVGEALVRNRVAWATAAGLDALYLLTTTAQDWFPRFGFERVDRSSAPPEIAGSEEFAELCPASAVVMRLDLRTPPSPVPDDDGPDSGAVRGSAIPHPPVSIRAATSADVPLILSFIRGLAEYERLPHEVVATEDRLRESLFGERPEAEVLLAFAGEAAAGFALFFHNYSTFLARRGLFLEDLFVVPERRGSGIGRRLLAEVARIAVERECGRLEWSVLDWNESAIGFYRAIGARPMDEWTVFRLTGESLRALADEPKR